MSWGSCARQRGTHKKIANRVLMEAVAMISGTMWSGEMCRETSAPDRNKDNDRRLCTVEFDAAVERVVGWKMEGIVQPRSA